MVVIVIVVVVMVVIVIVVSLVVVVVTVEYLLERKYFGICFNSQKVIATVS